VTLREPAFDFVFDAQRAYRVVLDAFARPGLVKRLEVPALHPPPGLTRAAAAAAFTLLDGNVTWHAVESFGPWEEYLRANTSSHAAPIEEAQFVFLHGESPRYAVELPSAGTLQYPDAGATLILQVDRLSQDAFDGAVAITLEGPGIQGRRTFHVSPLHTRLLESLAHRNSEFPIGVDTLFCADEDGEGNACVAGLPRSSKLWWSR
jgi:alpha-D-ribose 1-methylphosphonate 5-triphosphate synthase subunit PhnH